MGSSTSGNDKQGRARAKANAGILRYAQNDKANEKANEKTNDKTKARRMTR
jgi:hypothetical protein